MQEKKINNLVINKVENQQTYEKMKTQGLINNDELYLVGGDNEGVTGVKGAKESAYRTGEVNLTAANIGALPDTTHIPSKTSDLTNDSDFATNNGVDGKLENKVDKVNGKALSTNDLTNTLKTNYDAAYTHSQSAHAPSNAERNTIVSVKKNGTVVTPDSSRAVNITVPTKVSELTNDSGYLTSHQSLADYAKKTDVTANTNAIATLNGNSSVEGSVDQKVSDAINDFATKVSEDGTINTFKELVDYVAEHGSEYTAAIADIAANKAAIDTLNGTGAGSVSKAVSDAQTTLQGNIDEKVDKVTGKGLSTNDLTAALKSNYDAAYTHSQSAHAPANAERNTIVGIQKNGSDVSIDSSTRKVNITVPTKVSELTNDSGYLTQHQDISGKVDKINGKGLSTNDYTTAEKTKLASIAEGANNYSHPTYTAKSSGLYKITINNLGHVSATAAVTKADITDLGIPAQDTTYILPVATSDAIGGVKSGGDFTVNSSTGVVTIKHQSLADYAKTADVNTSLNGKVPTTRKINNKALSADITLSASDISGTVRYDTASQDLTSTQKANARTNIGAGTSSFSGSYNDLTNKPTIPSAITESTVSGWGFTKNTGTYSKPSNGIPKSDLVSDIQTSLSKADTALQSLPSHTHNYAGSSSAGGAANSVKSNLTIGLNSGTTEGTDLFTFNGSIAKSINITPNSIGAAASDHTHSYLPLSGGTLTGNLTGKYLTGTWLQTTAATDKAGKFATIDNDGWIYYRTASEVASDIGAVTADTFVAYTEAEIQSMWDNISV